MGFFSRLFGGGGKNPFIIGGKNPNKGFLEANRFNRARGGFAGGYGAWTFQNIIDAHSSADDIVDEFGLDQEDCSYKHPYLGATCYKYAYNEALQEAQEEAILESIFGFAVDAEDLIDWEQVEEDAYDYAVELAEMYINGDVWIPNEIIEWAYYDVSDHNM